MDEGVYLCIRDKEGRNSPYVQLLQHLIDARIHDGFAFKREPRSETDGLEIGININQYGNV